MLSPADWSQQYERHHKVHSLISGRILYHSMVRSKVEQSVGIVSEGFETSYHTRKRTRWAKN